MTVEAPRVTPSAPPRLDIRAALRRAAVQASRAPSVHNSQPWRFVLRGDLVEVHADWSRHVSSYDPLGRQLLISCGCAVLNLRASLAASGWAADVVRFPDPRRRQVVALVAPLTDGTPEPGLARLDRAIARRRTARGTFAGTGVETETLAALAGAAAVEGVTVVSLDDPGRRTFEELTVAATRLRDADPVYRAELRAWTSPDRDRHDGVPGGGPAISLLPGHADVGGPACLVLATESDDQPTWAGVGEALERVLLEITVADLSARPMTQAIEVPELRDRLREATGRGDLHPQVAVLLGEAPPAAPTRRRRLVDVITEVG